MNRLKLGTKFNALLLFIFIVGSVLGGFFFSALMRNLAEETVAAKAEILIEAMNSVRNYTSTQIKPLLSEDLTTKSKSLLETAFADSAQEVFENFRRHPDYQSFLYKEVTLNPVNPKDKGNEMEVDLLTKFEQNPHLKEKTGYYQGDMQKYFYIARPLSIKKPICSQCHSLPQDDSQSEINPDDSNNNSAEELNKIIAIQTIYVPANKVFSQTDRYYQYYQLAIVIFMGIFTCLIILINLLLNRAVIQPLKQLTKIAQKLKDVAFINSSETQLQFQILALIACRRDEIGQLGQGFQEMNSELIAREEKLARAQAKIKRSEAYFRSLIEQASDVILILDCQQVITYTSLSVSPIFGYQPETLTGENFLAFVAREDKNKVEKFLNGSGKANLKSKLLEFRFRHQNDTWLTVEASADNLLEDPIVNGIVINLRNITERQKADERLRLLESVVVNSNDAVVITEAESLEAPDHPKIVYVNEAFTYITGYTPEEIIGQTPRILQGKKTDPHTLKEIKQSLTKRIPIKTEVINYGKNGREYWVELNIIPIADRTGRYTHFVSVERDITKRKQAEQELRGREVAIRTLYQLTARQDISFSIRIASILNMGCQQFNLDVGILSKIEGDIYRIVAVKIPADSTLEVAIGDIFSVEQTCCERTIQTEYPLSFYSSVEENLAHPCYLDSSPQAYLGTRVMVGGEVYGTLNFSSLTPLANLLKPSKSN